MFKKNILLILVNLFLIFLSIFIIYFIKANYFFRKSDLFVNDPVIIQDSALGFILKPNIEIQNTHSKIKIFTDELGFRSFIKGDHAPDSVDILGIGCSFTWGDGVAIENTFLELLKHKTTERIYNIAVPSYGAVTAFLCLRRMSYLKPKIVIYGFMDDHIVRSMQPCAPCESSLCRPVPFIDFNEDSLPYIHKPFFLNENYYKSEEDLETKHNFGLKDIYWTFMKDLIRIKKQDAVGLNGRYYKNISEESTRREAIHYILEHLVNYCKEIDAKLIIVYIPIPDNIHQPPTEFSSNLKELVNNKDVFYLNLYSSFLFFSNKYGINSLKAMGGKDSHPGEKAHQLIALELYPLVERLLRKDYL